MNHWQQVQTVAWWEFRRFYKIRDQILALVLAIIGGSVGFLFKAISDSGRQDIKVVMVNTSPLQLPPKVGESIVIESAEQRTPAELEESLERKDIDGILYLRGIDDAEIIVRKEPYWENDLRVALTQARGRDRLQTFQLDAMKLADVLAPATLKVTVAEDGVQPKRKAEKALAAIIVVLTMLGLWIGLAFFLIGITGEKQLRVTEQVVAAISPQSWIDGKLIGLTGVALASMGTYIIAGTLAVVMLKLSGTEIPIPEVAASPIILLTFLLLAALGILFWNCFFGMVSATINDPYTSARGSLMMLPLLPVFFAGMSMSNPDALWIRILGITPGFSSAVLPARMVLTDVAWWEPILAMGLLVVGIWFFRRLAGKVFAAGILMHGKEPSLREIWHWLRKA